MYRTGIEAPERVLVEKGGTAREDMGLDRLRLVHGPLRDDADLAPPRRPEPVGNPAPGGPGRLPGPRPGVRAGVPGRHRQRTSRRGAAPGSDVYLQASQYAWLPVVRLRQGAEYTLHLSSLDVNHGFSLYPLNINFQVVPGYDYGLRIVPNQPGEFHVMCNEFCGIGHHLMVGKIIVEPAGATAGGDR